MTLTHCLAAFAAVSLALGTLACEPAAPANSPSAQTPAEEVEAPETETPPEAPDSSDPDAPPQTGIDTYEPPIELTIDLHMDPIPQVPMESRRELFHQRVENAWWMVNTLEGTGARISFLAGPEFYEFCREPEEADSCPPLLEALYASGGSLGTHTHNDIRGGAHDWPQLPGNATDDEARQSWYDAVESTDQTIAQVFGISDPEAIRAINNIHGSHLPKSDQLYDELMREIGFSVLQSGPEEDFYALFGHHIWSSYRPSPANWMTEDPSTPYVLVPSGPVIGKISVHKGIQQDMGTPHVKAMLVQVMANRRHAMLTGAADTAWTYGFAMHGKDIDPGSDTRAGLEEFVAWANENFVGKTSPEGHLIARWAGRYDVAQRFAELEAAAAGGAAMFSYPSTERDESLYPYLLPIADGLQDAQLEAILDAPEGVTAFLLTRGGEPVVLAWADGAAVEVDMSEVFGDGAVTQINTSTGEEANASTSAVTVGADALLLGAVQGDVEGPSDPGGVGGPEGGTGGPKGACGDGTCDAKESADPALCPADCG